MYQRLFVVRVANSTDVRPIFIAIMRLIQTNINGELTAKDIKYFGGQYSFWDKVRKRGIGSAKIIYDSGIEEFDKLKRNITGEIGFVNFELLKNGLILRLNITQRFSCIGIKLDEIKEINLIAYRIRIEVKRNGVFETKIVHRGILEIITLNEGLRFSIVVREFESIVNYFKRDEFLAKFYFSVSTNPPEKDYNFLEAAIEYLQKENRLT